MMRFRETNVQKSSSIFFFKVVNLQIFIETTILKSLQFDY